MEIAHQASFPEGPPKTHFVQRLDLADHGKGGLQHFFNQYSNRFPFTRVYVSCSNRTALSKPEWTLTEMDGERIRKVNGKLGGCSNHAGR